MYEIFINELEKQGKKPADICKETGIPASTFSDWKKGKSKPNTEKLVKISKFLGVKLEYLLGIEEEQKEPAYNELKKLIARNGKEMSNEEKMELIKLLSQLD